MKHRASTAGAGPVFWKCSGFAPVSRGYRGATRHHGWNGSAPSPAQGEGDIPCLIHRQAQGAQHAEITDDAGCYHALHHTFLSNRVFGAFCYLHIPMERNSAREKADRGCTPQDTAWGTQPQSAVKKGTSSLTASNALGCIKCY